MGKELLSQADIRINGSRAWDIQLHHTGFFKRVLQQGSLGLGESYMEGWWDCQALDQLFYRIMRGDLEKHFRLGVISNRDTDRPHIPGAWLRADSLSRLLLHHHR